MAHEGFAKVGKWKAVRLADSDYDFAKASHGLQMFDEVFGRDPDDVFVLTGKIKHAKDLTIQVIGDQAGVYVIDGDLIVGGTLAYHQVDGGSILYVTGKVECGDLALGSSANLWVGKDLTVENHVVGFLDDAGSIIVHGTLTADAWLEGHGRGARHFGKRAKIKTFIRWEDEELEGFPKVTLAEGVVAKAFLDGGSYAAMTKALGTGKPLLAPAAERAKRQKAAKVQAAAKPASAELDLSDKNLSALPVTLFGKPLAKLVIGGYRLAKISADLGKMKTLQELGVKHASAKALPASLGELPLLRVLDLRSSSAITDLPASLVKRNALKELTWGPLAAMPAAVAKLTGLERLSIWGESTRRMKAFPTAIAKLQGLRALSLRWHVFETIPDELLELQNLEELDLWCSLGLVKRIPDLTKLPALRDLWFSGASSGQTGDGDADVKLLEAIHDLPNLETLRLLNWKTWKPLLGCLERLVTLPKLRRLDVSTSAPGRLPDKLLAMPELAEVVLPVDVIPQEVRDHYASSYPRIKLTYA